MCGLFDYDQWDDEADYLVLDDIPFDFFHGMRKSLWGSQLQLVITGKYRKPRSVRWGKPMIWLCNEGQDFITLRDKRGELYLDYAECDWYKKNATIVDVQNKLY